MKHHYTYRIQFSSGRWYIGKRSSNVLPERDTSYNGSGVRLKRYMKAHPDVEYQKIILETYQTSEEAYAAEALLVGDLYLTSTDCLNLMEGGRGGGAGSKPGPDNPFFGKRHTDETKRKLREAKLGQGVGAANGNFGKVGQLKGKTGEAHPNFGRTGEKNWNYGKRFFKNLNGHLIMTKDGEQPEGYFHWHHKGGFRDRSLNDLVQTSA